MFTRSSSAIEVPISNPKTRVKRRPAVILATFIKFSASLSQHWNLACNKAVALQVPFAEKKTSRRLDVFSVARRLVKTG